MPENDLLLPAGSRLLHVGPPKTGTTAIQGALKQARAELSPHGVVYPGKDRQHSMAARAVLGTTGPKGDPPVDPKSWTRLVRQVAAAGDRRVVVSSEVFSVAGDEAVRTIVPALGGPEVHVLVTLRPLVKILPSAWQQFVRQGLRTSYESWLARMLAPPPRKGRVPPFWNRHGHDRLVERWASVAGAENLTVVVVDESDRLMLLRVFEQLLGLPSGLLQPERLTNPSLTFGEVELVRHLNREFHARGWSDQRHRALVRKGLVRHLQLSDRPLPDDQRIRTPAWAAERAAEIGAAAAARISASGVRIVGDISVLGELPDLPPDGLEPAPRPEVPAVAAMQAVVGMILATTRKAAKLAPPVVVPVPNGSPKRRTLAGIRARLRMGH